MARPFSDEEGAKLVPEIKEKAAERDAELTLPVVFASSSNFCEDSQIKESDPSMAYLRALAFLRASSAILTRHLFPPCWIPPS